MNAAARLVHQGVFPRQLVLTHALSWRQVGLMSLVLATLISALSIIYVTHTSRELYASYQHQLTELSRLQIERGQLLLERSTMMMQARIEHMATKKLGMVIPDHKSVVIIHE